NYGESGIVYPDGRLVQFTRAEADNIAEIGEAGVVMHDGTHVQFDRDMAAHHAGTPPQPMPVREMLAQPYGYSGIMKPDGNNRQFTAAESDNLVLVGPSGAVTADGKNVQFTDAGLPT
uniref:Cuticle protein CP1243 n=1 Tax=Cancer pagurus TaxID=6755 RepID=CUPC2_CANPG|nr:RecName: Full=Cuticle protein CP1243; Short=CPCP1243 [Cancer pagurus]